MTSTEGLPTKGIYTLIIFLSSDTELKVGKLGTQTFPAGYYTYTGSALGKGATSLKQRVTRHLKKQKQKFWHIDFLLAHENATITAIIAAQTSRKLECKMNRYIIEELKPKIPVVNFGASDCKENCKSHLLHFNGENIRSKIEASYTDKLGLKPVIIDLTRK
ncbi:GIY-YIG nuclease family protein [Candidatus Bathyarchaeota archaeon]|nr:MAG: GIY-YIG nuclease family protein [Candidatus Bathyarchaeota archaeon]